MYALLGRFVGIDEFFPTKTKFYDLDLDFALQWTHTNSDFKLLCFFFNATSISYNNSEYYHDYQLQGHIHFFNFIFSVHVVALQSGLTAFSGFLFYSVMLTIKIHVASWREIKTTYVLKMM